MHTDRDYRVFEKTSAKALEHDVHHMMHTHGWRPVGPVSVNHRPGLPYLYCQAMISARAVRAMAEHGEPFELPPLPKRQAE